MSVWSVRCLGMKEGTHHSYSHHCKTLGSTYCVDGKISQGDLPAMPIDRYPGVAFDAFCAGVSPSQLSRDVIRENLDHQLCLSKKAYSQYQPIALSSC